jgi:hypothetical protein
MPNAKIRQIKNQILERIIGLFERSSDSQTFALIEKAEDNAATSRHPLLIYETKLSPS